MNCRICGNSLLPGRVVFRCQCGILTHGYCWQKHVVDSHSPPYTLGYVTMNGEFRPREREAKQRAHPADKESVAAGRK